MLTCRPGQICAYSRAEFPIKVDFLTRPGAAAALPARLAAVRPTATPGWAWRPPARGGPVRGAAGPQQPCPTPARPRAPLTACGGKARANNRGLAGRCKIQPTPRFYIVAAGEGACRFFRIIRLESVIDSRSKTCRCEVYGNVLPCIIA